jgi:hypothetical protein
LGCLVIRPVPEVFRFGFFGLLGIAVDVNFVYGITLFRQFGENIVVFRRSVWRLADFRSGIFFNRRLAGFDQIPPVPFTQAKQVIAPALAVGKKGVAICIERTFGTFRPVETVTA